MHACAAVLCLYGSSMRVCIRICGSVCVCVFFSTGIPSLKGGESKGGDESNTEFIYCAIFSMFYYLLPCSRLIINK